MSSSTMTRRAFVVRAASLGLITVAGPSSLQGCGGAQAICTDSELLSAGERQMRATREYVNASADNSRQCQNCEFFTEGQAAIGCGHCEILNGDVSAAGYCNAWARRAA